MKQPPPVAFMWQRYADKMLAKGLPADQQAECERAFYGGFVMFETMMETAPGAERLEIMLGMIRVELAAFILRACKKGEPWGKAFERGAGER